MTTTATTSPVSNTWTDSQGRRWTVGVKIGDARRLKAAGIDLLDPAQLQAILADELAQLDLLRRLLEPQAAGYDLTDAAAFEAALTADLDDFPKALAALLGELSLFFRRLARHKPAALLAAAAAEIAAGPAANASPSPTPGPDFGSPPAA